MRGIFLKLSYLKNEIKKIEPDYVISLATPKTSILLSIVSFVRDYKLVISERNDPAQYPKGLLIRKLRNIAYRMADGIVFQTHDAKDYFNKLAIKNAVVIPNPVSVIVPEEIVKVRKKKIVNFCRIEPQKNIRMLIDAFLNLPSKYKDYSLEIYGIGDQLDEIKKYVSEKGETERVIFHGFVNNIHEKIIDASVFVSSSDYEGISNSMIEALALGLPVICTDCPIGGARMMITSGENGLLVPVKDVISMTKAIEYMLNNKEAAERMGENAKKIMNEYSPDSISLKWISFMRGL